MNSAQFESFEMCKAVPVYARTMLHEMVGYRILIGAQGQSIQAPVFGSDLWSAFDVIFYKDAATKKVVDSARDLLKTADEASKSGTECACSEADGLTVTCVYCEARAALNAIGDSFVHAAEKSQAAKDVIAERVRQKCVEGWTEKHDDDHDGGTLAAAASAYALWAANELSPYQQGDAVGGPPPAWWPFERSAWNPKDARHDLVRAGALILAEIERIDRSTRASDAKGSGD